MGMPVIRPYPVGYEFPVPFGYRLSLFGTSCSRWRVVPRLRLAYHLRGLHRGFHVPHVRDVIGCGCLLYPGSLVPLHERCAPMTPRSLNTELRLGP
jgi:hypothetical protein